MKRKMFSLALGLFVPFLTVAADEYSLSFELTDGTNRSFAFREEPVITFVDNMITVTTQTEAVNFDRSQVARYQFADVSDGIAAIDGLTIKRVSNDLLRVAGAPADVLIDVWSVGGVKGQSVRVDGAGCADVDLSQLPAGAYVVRVGECQTLKIVKQ